MAISLSTFDTVLHDIDPVKHPRWSFLQIFAKNTILDVCQIIYHISLWLQIILLS